MSFSADLHLSDDRITDLVLGLLSAAESEESRAHLRHCAPCEDRFLQACRESEVLRLRARPAIGSFGKPPSPEAAGRWHAEPARAGWRGWVAWGGFAAAAVLLIGILYGLSVRTPSDDLDYWLPVETAPIVARSGAARAPSQFTEAIEAYARHDTRRVVALLQGQTIPEEQEPLQLVLASALVRERRAAEARTLLENLEIETLPLPARDRARWILVAALWQEEDHFAADVILRDLAAHPGEFSDRAGRLLSRNR